MEKKKAIQVKGARVNNLKNIDVECVADSVNGVKHVEALTVENVTYNTVDRHALPQLDKYLGNK